MKRIIALILIVAMALSLAACSSPGSETTAGNAGGEVQENNGTQGNGGDENPGSSDGGLVSWKL